MPYTQGTRHRIKRMHDFSGSCISFEHFVQGPCCLHRLSKVLSKVRRQKTWIDCLYVLGMIQASTIHSISLVPVVIIGWSFTDFSIYCLLSQLYTQVWFLHFYSPFPNNAVTTLIWLMQLDEITKFTFTFSAAFSLQHYFFFQLYTNSGFMNVHSTEWWIFFIFF